MQKFKIGDRVRVHRVIPADGESVFSSEYPRLGWTATVDALYGEVPGIGRNQISVLWDEEFLELAKHGDLVFLWQIEKIGQKEWDNEENI